MVEDLDVLVAQVVLRPQAIKSIPQRLFHHGQAPDYRMDRGHVDHDVRHEYSVQGLKVFAVDIKRVERGRIVD